MTPSFRLTIQKSIKDIILLLKLVNPLVQPYSIPASERVSKVKEQSTRSLAFAKASERAQCGRSLSK